MTLERIASGSPTGADRAALDVALVLGLAVGDGCPQSRRAEDGIIPDRYPLVETPEPDDAARTRRNIEDSDGTLIPNQGAPDGGTASTADHARQVGQPCRVVALAAGIDPAAFRGGLAEPGIRVLNSPVWASLPQRSGIYGEPRAKARPIILAYPMKGPRFGFTVVHAVDPTAGRAVGSTLGSRALHLDPRHRRSALERTPT